MPSDLLILVLVLVVIFLLAGTFSPFEALGWWAGWYGHEFEPPTLGALEPSPPTDTQHFVVFLSGINNASAEAYAEREEDFLQGLNLALPHTAMVDGVFPYSVTNLALTGQRLFAWLWRWALERKLRGPKMIGFLINVRNFWQVAVSADKRYGPIYNQGCGDIILRSLRERGYRLGSGVPVTLIGYSGGAQIAVGAAPHLKALLRAPVSVIALGGVISADPGLLELEHLYYLYGRHDMVQRFGQAVFPGRWRLLPHSPWNQARLQGIIQRIPMGPMTHTGARGYLSEKKLPGGRTHLEYTLGTIRRIVTAIGMDVSGEPPARGRS
jgi:hypothetical protein